MPSINMKSILQIEGSMADKITGYHAVIFAAALPFDRLYSELALISLLLHTLFHLRKNSLKGRALSKLLIPVSIYLLTLVATIYTSFSGEALYEWERQLALLLWPLVIFFNPFDWKRYSKFIIAAMGISCCMAVLYLYYTAFTIVQYNHLPFTAIFTNAFLNHRFAEPIDMHATYFSMYILLGSVGILYLFTASKKIPGKLVYGLILCVLLAGLMQLSSRAALIAFFVIMNVVVPFFFIPVKKRVWYITASVLVSLSMILLFIKMEDLHKRVIVDLTNDLAQTSDIENTEPRMVRWRAASGLILQSPVHGHGSGSEIALLKEVYFEKKLYRSFLNELNVHNQYLSMLIKTGAIGLLVWLYVLFAGIKTALRSRDGLFISFLVIICAVSFSENILDANKGIFFFAFFFSLFYLGNRKPVIQK